MVVEMVYVVVTYDVNEEKVNKIRKILKKYLNWVQNSVFEGEITEGKLEKCKIELSLVIDKSTDSIYFYLVENKNNIKKTVVGMEKDAVDNVF